MLTGGFPCQDISRAGPGGGVEHGERSGLWSEYARAIREIRPEIALIENVSAITHRGLDVVLADLAKAGYDAEWTDLRARDVGALHKRERLFVIAYRNGDGREHGCSDIEEVWGGSFAERLEQVVKSGEQDFVQPVFDSDTWEERIQRVREIEVQEQRGLSWCKDIGGIEDLRGRSDLSEPLLRGRDNGVSAQVDRTKAVGNAVVPQCAEVIGHVIADSFFP